MALRPPAGARRRAAASALLALALTGALAGCAVADGAAEQYRAGDNKGYVAANGFAVVEIPVVERTEPIEFEGMLDTGEAVTSDDYAGTVLVVNFWYAGCGPCIVEAPRLEEAFQSTAGDGVAFLGMNTRDTPETSLSFAKDNGVSYPSAIAANDGALKLAFASAVPLSATPVTLVLDKQGRVASRVIGEIPDASVLESLVRDALAEQS
jgi:peroxiredoxin